MRPDEHKKKKSAQYKKKHGTQASKGDNDQKNEAQNRRGGGPKMVAPDAKADLKTAKTNDEGAVRKDSTETVFPSFSKRTIQSNWERYEPLHDASSDEDQGADFNVLLSFAGGSSSYKQLESEKDWAEVGGADLSGLTIDCQQLAEAFEDLSFCEKYNLNDLGLDPDILKYVESIDNDASARGNQLDESILSDTIAEDLGFNFSNLGSAKSTENNGGKTAEKVDVVEDSMAGATRAEQGKITPRDTYKKPAHEETVDPSGKESDDLLPSPTGTSVLVDHSIKHLHSGGASNRSSTEPKTISQATLTKTDQNELDDAALDDLLSAKQQEASNKPSYSITKPEVLISQPRQDAGSILGGEDTNVQSPKPSMTQTKDDDADDLESWLDSVL